jgi:hypothetical protein
MEYQSVQLSSVVLSKCAKLAVSTMTAEQRLRGKLYGKWFVSGVCRSAGCSVCVTVAVVIAVASSRHSSSSAIK